MLVVSAGAAAHPFVKINEVLSVNDGILADGAGDFDPVIEIYNGGVSPVPLSYMRLASTLEDTAGWRMPRYIIFPREFVLVWADGEPEESDTTSDDGDGWELHAPFRLEGGVGHVIMWDESGEPGVPGDSVTYVSLPGDRSYAREIDTWGFFKVSVPSLGFSNEGTDAGDPLPRPPAVTVVRMDPLAPNPFNPWVRVPVFLQEPVRRLLLEVFDSRGRRVHSIHDGPRPAGASSWNWDGRDAAGRSLPSGLYRIRLDADGEVVQRRAVLAR